MTTTGHPDQAVSDPIGLIVDLIAAVERQMEPEQIRAVVTAVAGGRAKSRRLAKVLADRPEVLAHGQSPAPRAVGDLLIALRKAGASTVSAKRERSTGSWFSDWMVWIASFCVPCAAFIERSSASKPRTSGWLSRRLWPRESHGAGHWPLPAPPRE